MDILTRRIVWRNRFAVARVPPIGLLHRAAYSPSARLRHELMKIPLRPLFAAAYRLGLGGRGAMRLRVKGAEKTLDFDGRNLQFAGLYMPQHEKGYEPETSAVLDALVGPQDVFYDAGSNWGYYSLMIASREDFVGKVHAFEPAAGSFRDLTDLVSQAGLSGRISCHNLALSDRSGDGRMIVPDGLHSGLAMVSAGAAGAPVELKKLDDLDIEPPHVIKMDVEDHEVQVLDGGRATVAKAKPYIVFESSVDRRVEIKMAPFERLAAMGYEFFHPAWRVESGGSARYVQRAELEDGKPQTLALVPFEAPQRLLLRDLLNVLACHRDRRDALKALFCR